MSTTTTTLNLLFLFIICCLITCISYAWMNEFGNVTIFECDHSLWLRIVHCVWHHDLGSSRDSIYFECLHLFATILVFWLLFWLLLLLVALLLLSIIIPINCYFQSHLCLCCQQYSLSTLFEASTTFCQYSSSIWCFFFGCVCVEIIIASHKISMSFGKISTKPIWTTTYMLNNCSHNLKLASEKFNHDCFFISYILNEFAPWPNGSDAKNYWFTQLFSMRKFRCEHNFISMPLESQIHCAKPLMSLN